MIQRVFFVPIQIDNLKKFFNTYVRRIKVDEKPKKNERSRRESYVLIIVSLVMVMLTGVIGYGLVCKQICFNGEAC